MAIDRSKMTQSDESGKILRDKKEEKNKYERFSWWRADEADMASQIVSTINFIKRHMSERDNMLVEATRLYGNASAYSYGGLGYSKSNQSAANPSTAKLSFNLCQSIIDTLVSKIAKNEITPTFITSGGVWGMQKKAENLSKFVEGWFYEQFVHSKIVDSFSDSACWGDGLVYVYRTLDEKAAVERVVPHEILVDPIETLLGNPRQMHRVKTVDRDVLLELFEDDKEAQAKIKDAMPANVQDLGGESAADLVAVSESWHLPSGPDAKDGFRALCIEDKTLLAEVYEKDYFPFPHLKYAKRKFGFWGQGVCERQRNLQAEINRNMLTIQKALWLQAGPKLAIENSSKIVTQHLSNEIASIIHYSEKPPMYLSPPIVQPEVYEWVEKLIQKGYMQEGVSQMNAANVKPLGIDSGAALRTYDQISDDRLLFVEKAVEAFGLEIARQGIEVVKDIHKDKKSYRVTWPGVSFTETIDWKDVALERDEYVLKAFPTSSLPEEPMAKIQTVKEYMQAGLISPRAGRRLFKMPDVEMSDMLANAAEDLLHKTFEDILYHNKKDIQPDGAWDLALANELYLEYYNFALLNNCPEENMQSMRDFKSQLDDLAGLTQPQGMPGPGQTGAPQAMPQPTPTSDLVPNVQGAA